MSSIYEKETKLKMKLERGIDKLKKRFGKLKEMETYESSKKKLLKNAEEQLASLEQTIKALDLASKKSS